jgi:mutator protein MutT
VIPSDAVIVVAAVIERDGAFLVARRQPGQHLAGCWEFPGGKMRDGETLEQALRREIREELNADLGTVTKIFETSHVYPGRAVQLHFYRCSLNGTPEPVLGQEIRWVRRDQLGSLEFPPADAALIAELTKPPNQRSSDR